MQVLLEASDLAGISVFLAMLVACSVAIILLPIETKGKSLRVSQCLYCRKVYVHIYVHDPCMFVLCYICTVCYLEMNTALFAFYISRRLEVCSPRRVQRDAVKSLPLYVNGGINTQPFILHSSYDVLYRHCMLVQMLCVPLYHVRLLY